MKKLLYGCALMLLILLVCPTDARAETHTVEDGLSLQIESWDEYLGDSIVLNNGSTLDLTGVSESPSSDVHVKIYDGTVTIKGNPNSEFDSHLRLEVYGSEGEGSTTIKLEDFRRTDNAVLLLFQSDSTHNVNDDNITIEYSGTNKAGISSGSDYSLQLERQDGVSLTLTGTDGASLDLAGDILISGYSNGYIGGCSLTLDGGTVNCGTIRQRYYDGNASITVKNGCRLQCDEISLLDGGTDSNGTITIDNADLTVSSENQPSSLMGSIDSQWGDYAGIGGIFGGQKIEITNGSTVTAYSHSSPVSGQSTPVYASPAIGNAESIVISNSEVTATAKYWGTDKRGGNSSGIGGGFDSIKITNSTINATGYFGAGIGSGGAINNDTHFSDTKIISIADSDVESVSTYGAGIGAGYTTSYTSNIGIMISGNSEITAVSQSGAGIGSGALGNFYLSPGLAPLIIGRADIKNWSDEDDQVVKAGTNSVSLANTSLLAAAPQAYDASSHLGTINGTLIISANANSETPTIQAESGVKAVNMTVSAGQPMMEYTLGDETDVPDTATLINRGHAEASGTDDGPGAPSYTLRPGFRSLAFWPVAAGTYELSYGSGDNPDPLLDATATVPTYSPTYTLSTPSGNNALQSFTVVRAQKLSGTVTLTDGTDAIDGTTTTSATLHLNLSGVTPTGVTSGSNVYLTYQWYKDGQPISGATANTYTPNETGVYYCAVTGTDRFWGILNSEAVTVVSDASNVPTAPTVTNTDTQITDDSITLDTPSDGNTYEYALVNNGNYTWQDSPTFSGLDRNTTYSFVQRVATTAESNEPGPVSAAASFTTKLGRPSVDVLTIDYVNETFSLKETGVSLYTDISCTSKITVDANASITDYIGTTLYAKYDDDTTEAQLNVNVTALSVSQRPNVPTLNSGMVKSAENSLTISGEAGVTYAIFNRYNTVNPIETITCENDSQKIVFDELASNTQYVIKARYEATDSEFKSLQARINVSTTASGSLATISVTPVAAGNSYSYNGEGHAFQYTTDPEGVTGFTVRYYQENNAETAMTDPPINVGTYNVIVTREVDETYAAYEQTFLNGLVITQGTQTAPDAPTMDSRTTTTITLNTLPESGKGTVQYGYVTAGGTVDNISNWRTSPEFTGLNPGTSYTFYARYAESKDENYAASPASGGTTIATLPNEPTGNPVTINYADETLTFANNYEVGTDANFTTTINSGDSISSIILAYGSGPRTLYVRVKAQGNIPASEAVEFTIPARPQAPTGLTPKDETFEDADDGSILGVTTDMEYRLGDTGEWKDCESETITGLAPGTYYVRTKATTDSFASAGTPVTIGSGEQRTYTLTVTAPIFESVRTGYTQPAAQPITITSSGNTAATISSVSVDSENFVIAGSGTNVPVGESINTWTIQPVAGLSAGTYTATITVTYDGGATATAQVSFIVEQPSTPSSPTYRVTINDLLHGSITSNHTWASTGTKVTLTITPDDGYQLDVLTITDRNGETVNYTTNADGSITFTMPRSGVTVSATFSEGTPAPEPGDEWPFVDVSEGDWFYDPVAWAYEQGLMTGTSATTFEPNISTTRGMIVAILHRLEDSPVVNYLMTFDDVANGAWYAEAVRWAASEGIVAGYSDAQFGPNDPITREQMAAILYNYAAWKGVDVSARADLSGYSDQPSAWAVEVMQWAKAEGLINGTTATTLDPQGHATRAQVAAILQRFLEN